MTVKYRTNPDFPKYRIGDDGTVWVKVNVTKKHPDGWKQIATRPDRRGRYKVVMIGSDGKRAMGYLHTWVLTAFNGPHKDDGRDWVAKHKNGDRGDNHLANLTWAVRDRSQDNHARGERHGRSKLKEATVRKVRAMSEGGKDDAFIAAKLGLNVRTVQDIINARTWAWLV